MPEPLSENMHPLNVAAKRKLQQAHVQEISPRHLYSLQLMSWACVENKLEFAGGLRRTLGNWVNSLLYEHDPQDSMEFLYKSRQEGDPDNPRVEASDLLNLDPDEAAKVLLDNLYDLLVELDQVMPMIG